MLQDTIQTSHQYHGLHTRLLNTCRKIATSRMTALTNQTDRDATLDVLKEMANASGQRSYLHQTKTAFLNHSRKMIRVLWWFVTETSDNTLGGDTPLNDDIMNRLPGSPSESTSTKESKRSLHESDSEVGTDRAAPPTTCHAGATRAPCTPLRHIVILEYCGLAPGAGGPAFSPPYRGAVNQSHPCLLNCRLIRKQAEIIDPMGTDEDWENTFVPQLR